MKYSSNFEISLKKLYVPHFQFTFPIPHAIFNALKQGSHPPVFFGLYATKTILIIFSFFICFSKRPTISEVFFVKVFYHPKIFFFRFKQAEFS